VTAGGTAERYARRQCRDNLNNCEDYFEVGFGIERGKLQRYAGPVCAVVGTLVCNPGSSGNAENAVDMPATKVNTEGNAEPSFKIIVPTVRNNRVFLVRVPSGRWIAR